MASPVEPSDGGGARPVLVVVCAAVFISVLNASIVNVVLPAIGEDLRVEPARLSWVITAYLLVYGVAIPIYGRLADLYGARRLFVLGLALFSVGSVACAVAPSFGGLILARIVQATGGAAVPGLGIALASLAFPVERRGAVIGVIVAMVGGAQAVGPTLGGLISGWVGWRWVFVLGTSAAVLVPIAALVLPQALRRAGERLDVAGAALVALVVSGSLFALTEGGRSGWGAPQVDAAAGVAALALVGLVLRQRRAPSPFVPRELLANGRYRALVVMSLACSAVNVAGIVGLPLLFTGVERALARGRRGRTPPGRVRHGAPRAPRRPGRRPSRRRDAGARRARDDDGGRARALDRAGGPVWAVSFLQALLGAGFAFVNTPLSAVVTLVVPPRLIASAVSINTMFFFLGGSIGTALLTAMLVARGGGEGGLNPLHAAWAPATATPSSCCSCRCSWRLCSRGRCRSANPAQARPERVIQPARAEPDTTSARRTTSSPGRPSPGCGSTSRSPATTGRATPPALSYLRPRGRRRARPASTCRRS